MSTRTYVCPTGIRAELNVVYEREGRVDLIRKCIPTKVIIIMEIFFSVTLSQRKEDYYMLIAPLVPRRPLNLSIIIAQRARNEGCWRLK